MVAFNKTSASKSDAEFEIGLGHFNGNGEAVVPGITADAAADCFDRIGDLFGGARLRAFEQHLRHQSRDAIGLRRFRQQTAAENRRHRDKRQPRIFANQNAQAIRQLEFLNFSGRNRFRAFCFRAERAFRIQRSDGEIITR